MKKTLALISAFLIVLGTASCGEGTKPSETQGEEKNGETAQNTEPAETEGLPDFFDTLDYGGRTFRIVYSADQLGEAWPYTADGENGDLLNDTVYQRNRSVMERCNVTLDFYNVGGTWSEVPNALLQSVRAGDNDYQLAISHTYCQVPSMASECALADFLEVPNIQLEKPWWNQSIKKNLTICGVLPIAVSDLVYSYADVIYFNAEMIGTFDLERPYELVDAGKWTWTKLADMAKEVASDLNGDGEYTVDDRYGFAMAGETLSLTSRVIHSNGLLMAEVKGDTVSVLGVSDRLQNAIENYYNLLYNDNKTYIGTVTDAPNAVEAFKQGNILFMHQTTLQLPKLRDTEVNFGIVPLPKYDEAQQNYSSMLSSQLLLIPNVVDEELEFAGAVTEVLSYESHRTVVPATYDSIFESKYLRDATSFEMYQQIRDSLICDFNWNYSNGNKINNLVKEVVYDKKTTDVASFLASVTPEIDTYYKELFESVRAAYEVE